MREAFLVFPPRGSLLSARKRKFNMFIVGLKAFHGDSAAAALRDGILVSAVEEERFTRVKHWTGFPSQSLQVCLRDSGYKDADRDSVVFSVSRKPDRYLAILVVLVGPFRELVTFPPSDPLGNGSRTYMEGGALLRKFIKLNTIWPILPPVFFVAPGMKRCA